MKEKILCIIPAKGGSTRLPKKNVMKLCGKPLIAYTIEAALQSGLFGDVFVSTEDDEVVEIAKDYGATIPYKRPEELAKDPAGVVDVCLHMIDYFEAQGIYYTILCVLLPTTPLRTYEDIKNAYKKFKEKRAKFLMGITNYMYSPFHALARNENENFKPYWGNRYLKMKAQELPEVLVDNGAIYLTDIDAFKKERTFYGTDLVGHYMPLKRSIDIDTRFHFKIAECLLRCEK